MLYRVLEGHEITWPDGSLRASSGQVFDGFDDPALGREVYLRAANFLRGKMGLVVPAPDERVTAPDVPDNYLAMFRAASGRTVEERVETRAIPPVGYDVVSEGGKVLGSWPEDTADED